MSKRLRRELERNQAKIAARPAPPPPVDPVAAQARVDAFRAKAKGKILATLEAHKAAHGTADLDKVAITTALVSFANLINGNRKFVPGPDTDALIRLGIDVIATATADAKRECEDRRIVLAG